jgi:hypothetical protein
VLIDASDGETAFRWTWSIAATPEAPGAGVAGAAVEHSAPNE